MEQLNGNPTRNPNPKCGAQANLADRIAVEEPNCRHENTVNQDCTQNSRPVRTGDPPGGSEVEQDAAQSRVARKVPRFCFSQARLQHKHWDHRNQKQWC